MKKLFLSTILALNCYASIENLQYFDADFIQNIKDDNNKVIKYNGHIKAAKPQYALWEYKNPINKQVFILPNKVVVIEPDLEQAIIKKLSTNFDIFTLIKNAEKKGKGIYIASFRNTKYTIEIKNDIIERISYKDEFENNVEIVFKNQNQNSVIEKKLFIPNIPTDFDIIRE
ncbi:LolA-like outer membrane lipoprotein chaperone [Sulfurimonas sp.]|uniref:LolA-like outer membrane lipoprotein chaperone n=1 Tax=Sulfurimonas sp. TaxID=2022749 RepID=UPI0026291271|nr:LolA-like outer membrane lipoprotein chaperone [Sulfurimonas sp.]